MKRKPKNCSVAVKPPTASQKPIARKTKIPDALIRDWDFSWVTQTNAKAVWLYEISRQARADYLAGLSEDQRALGISLGELSKPYAALTAKELEGLRYPNAELKPHPLDNGDVIVIGALGKYFGTPNPKTRKSSNLHFTFEIHPYIHPANARQFLLKWFDCQVVPKLKHPDRRRGPKSNHVSWLADLAIYRASKAAVTFGQMKLRVEPSFPNGFSAKSLLTSRIHQTGAKSRTRQRIVDLAQKGFQFSPFGYIS